MPKDLKKGVGQLLVKRLLKITVTGGSVRSEMPGQLPLKQGGQFVVKQVGQLGVKYSGSSAGPV